MPGLLLHGAEPRDGILIHPGHPPSLYLSSIGCFNPTNPLSSDDVMNIWDSRARVIALIESLKGFFPNAFVHETSTHIKGATVIVDGEPKDAVPDAMLKEFASANVMATPASLPVSKKGAKQCAEWMVKNFGAELTRAVKGKPYEVEHLCAIVCQETAYKWLKWIGKHPTKTIIDRCVFDASGDYPGTSRSAFPQNTAAFRKRFGKKLTDLLIEEANITRRLQDYGDQVWVYKGYGILQYDLQHIESDESFFQRGSGTASMNACRVAALNSIRNLSTARVISGARSGATMEAATVHRNTWRTSRSSRCTVQKQSVARSLVVHAAEQSRRFAMIERKNGISRLKVAKPVQSP